VYRSAGSKGAADLIALKDGKIVLIQVKVNKKPSRSEVAKLLKEAKKCKAIPLLVLWNSKKKQQNAQIAEKNCLKEARCGVIPCPEADGKSIA